MHKTLVINAVGLTPALLAQMPSLLRFLDVSFQIGNGRPATIREILPAVTCSVQATYLTGQLPQEHGIVGNGWYDRHDAEVKFWKQSNGLVTAERLWDTARHLDPSFTCANINWWHAMYSSATATVTPRPMYPADGRKVPDIWTHPSSLRDELQKKLGPFPLFKYWGPATSIEATRWLASAAIEVDERLDPTLTLLYLPHLDYNLQRYGPADARIATDLRELDAEVARLVRYFNACGARIVILSEYGISAVIRPIHLNRTLRERGLLAIRDELGRDMLDAGASAAFAVADHQIAHIYVNDRSRLDEVVKLIADEPGVASVYVDGERRTIGLDHPRAGDIVALARPESWFTYFYWLDDARAPDFARTVDIHRKPGYDPVELFIDPAIRFPKLKVATTLARRKLGQRPLMDVIPLDATLVQGSHGVPALTREARPVFISTVPGLLDRDEIDAIDVRDLLMRHLTD